MQQKQAFAPLPSFALVIAAHYRRRYLTCERCGGRGFRVGELTGRLGIPDEWEIGCINCGHHWWIPKRLQ